MSVSTKKFGKKDKEFRLKDGTVIKIFWSYLAGNWSGCFSLKGQFIEDVIPACDSRRKVVRRLRLAIARATNPTVAATCERLFPVPERPTLSKIASLSREQKAAARLYGTGSEQAQKLSAEIENLRKKYVGAGGYENGNA